MTLHAFVEYDTRRELTPKEILKLAIIKYGVRHFAGMFSGGKDSYLTCVISEQAIKEIQKELGTEITFEVLHCYTGTGSHKTFDYLLKKCQEHDWKLTVQWPDNNPNYPQNVYIRMLYDKGFLGRSWHAVWFRILKVDGMREYHRNNPDTWLISGKAPTNSQRRKTQMEKALKKGKTLESLYCGIDDGLPSVKPMFFKTKADTWEMIRELELELVSSYALANHSWECLCPTYATQAEKRQLEIWAPDNAIDINILDYQYGGWHKVQDKRGRWYMKNFGKWAEPVKTKMLKEEQEQLEWLADLVCVDCSAPSIELEY